MVVSFGSRVDTLSWLEAIRSCRKAARGGNGVANGTNGAVPVGGIGEKPAKDGDGTPRFGDKRRNEWGVFQLFSEVDFV